MLTSCGVLKSYVADYSVGLATVESPADWADWEDVSTGDVKTDGFEHPNYDDNGEW